MELKMSGKIGKSQSSKNVMPGGGVLTPGKDG